MMSLRTIMTRARTVLAELILMMNKNLRNQNHQVLRLHRLKRSLAVIESLPLPRQAHLVLNRLSHLPAHR